MTKWEEARRIAEPILAVFGVSLELGYWDLVLPLLRPVLPLFELAGARPSKGGWRSEAKGGLLLVRRARLGDAR